MFCNTIDTPPDIVTQLYGKDLIIKWPNYVMFNTPNREWYPIRCIRKGNYVKFISGDPRLMREAGSYYNELFRIQRKFQALDRKKEIQFMRQADRRFGTRAEWHLDGFYFCYPQRGWKQQGLRLKTVYEVMKWPFQSLYTQTPISEADLGIARSGSEMDRRIREFRNIMRTQPDLPSTERRLDQLYNRIEYLLGKGKNDPGFYTKYGKTKQQLLQHHYIDTSKADQFSSDYNDDCDPGFYYED